MNSEVGLGGMMRAEILLAIGIGVVASIVVVLAMLAGPESSRPNIAGSSEPMVAEAMQGGISASGPTPQADSAAETPSRSEAVDKSSDIWIFIALATMAVALVLSSAISFYLYRWRKILLSNPHMLVPEQLGKLLENMGKHFQHVTVAVSKSLTESELRGQQTEQGINNLSETFLTMQQALDDREQEIRRLKRGYDSEVFRKFVTRFIRVDQAVEDFQRSGSADEDGLDQIKRLLEDAFAECNVEYFRPELGSDYRDAFGVAEPPKTENSGRAEDDWKIVEILESGYCIRSPENNEVIMPAKVRIYRYQEEG